MFGLHLYAKISYINEKGFIPSCCLPIFQVNPLFLHKMKLLLFYRITFIAILAALSPFALMASSVDIDKPIRRELAGSFPMFQDTTGSKKKTSNKPREGQKPPQDGIEERLREAQRRAIKQVPRSLPKLKPQPVTGRAKIRGRQ